MALLVRCTRGQTHESMHRPQKMGLAAVYTKCKWIHRSVLSIHSRRLAGPTENYHSFFLLNLSFDRCFAVDVEKWNIGWVFFFFKTIAHVHFLHFVVHSNRTCAPAKCVLRDVWVIYLRIDTDRYIAFYFNQFLSFFFFVFFLSFLCVDCNWSQQSEQFYRVTHSLPLCIMLAGVPSTQDSTAKWR